MSREFVIDAGAGDRFSRWSLAGLSEANTFGGRLWMTWLTRAMALYRDPGLHSKVASVAAVTTTAVGTTLTIAAVGGSGLSGSVFWKATGEGDVAAASPASLFATYAFSSDMVQLEKAVATLLPIGGATTFAAQLAFAKIDVDQVVRRRWADLLEQDPLTGRPDWRGFRDLRTELAAAQTYRALFWTYTHKTGRPDDDFAAKADRWLELYEKELAGLSLQIDIEADGVVDREPTRLVRFRRA